MLVGQNVITRRLSVTHHEEGRFLPRCIRDYNDRKVSVCTTYCKSLGKVAATYVFLKIQLCL